MQRDGGTPVFAAAEFFAEVDEGPAGGHDRMVMDCEVSCLFSHVVHQLQTLPTDLLLFA